MDGWMVYRLRETGGGAQALRLWLLTVPTSNTS